ncbi:multiheme c-type cytochrome [Acidicapsa ligni]|uniref:multiheme c-type cytochrome n=1 Tax=Acidicapsa ligni TaxID=542300 RepID=UPI0021E019FA|nr:multiheme c-type cytochrome [Acidicapsa ligni]
MGWPSAVSAGKISSDAATFQLTDPNAACAKCHQAIYKRYRTTPMARASGLAIDGFMPASFTHPASGISYRISEEDRRVWLSFERDTTTGSTGQALQGRRELKYFLGSGKRGRTYLFEDEGYWFEIPINWYAKKQVWDMAPNYLTASEMPLTLPVDPGCLRCHASSAQPSLPQARNKYASVPFLHGGITCEACHGNSESHIASRGKQAMTNLNELKPAQRDSICLNCHLEGQAAIVHQGRRLVDFHPGESIFDYASFFVHKAEAGSGGRATSQWEALLQSACKRGAGDKLTCTSCHDPHGTTDTLSQPERIAFYRARCLQCHGASGSATASGATFVKTHHPENVDCVSCHMSRNTSNDIAHEQVTDHRILRIAASGYVPPAKTGPLVAVGATMLGSEVSERDLGLAYAQMAAGGDRDAATRAHELLQSAEKHPEADTDHELHDQLGFLDQLAANNDAAGREYGLALKADADDAFAAGNLALLKAGEKKYGTAIDLWQQAFQDDPVELRAGMNLAIVECGVGQREAALRTLNRILQFSPDHESAKVLLREIQSGRRSCSKP